MKSICIDDKWSFRKGIVDSLGLLKDIPGKEVDLPHDGMIGTPVSPEAPAKSDSGYFVGNLSNYTKYIMIPKEWEGDCVGLKLDGAMMNVTVDVNGCKVGGQHYGYAPFYLDLTKYISFGEENRVTINCNTTMQVNSRWYTGSGLYRGAQLLHGPRVHIVPDGIFLHTKEVRDGYAFIEARIETENTTLEDRLARVTVSLAKEATGEVMTDVNRVIRIGAGETETAILAINLKDPLLWDCDEPNLYNVTVSLQNLGTYRTHFIPEENSTLDEASTLFGVRTITADAVYGLRINGKTVKLKGGCLHHDNGLLGSVSLYEAEKRKIEKLKEIGFNAVRTAHNPPSAALIEACDRLGMYVFDEAFDAWGIAKRSGDYSQFFDSDWKKDISSFIKRDRNHPSVIIWSTGNEIPERGGLNNGYSLATDIALEIKKYDPYRPVSNGICTLWSGMDDKLMAHQSQNQNSSEGLFDTTWETVTEPFTNGLDIVGCNYMEDIYERDHEMFPERVILGSENFSNQIGYRWPLVEKLPYVIGDFTWTAWDYLGEAGIGKAAYVDEKDENNEIIRTNGWALMPPSGSPYPWRCANDADFDITGNRTPQGAYRSVVWGSGSIHLFSQDPSNFGKKEITTLWGFPELFSSWNYEGYEGRDIRLVVFSNADEVELIRNGRSLGKKAVNMERPMPCSAVFDTIYEPGTVEAISYREGKEVSRDKLVTTGKPAALKLLPEKSRAAAEGHDLIYVGIEVVDSEGRVVPNAAIAITGESCGSMSLAGFGSANPITEDDYTDDETITYKGRALAILRSGYEPGKFRLTITGEGLGEAVFEGTMG